MSFSADYKSKKERESWRREEGGGKVQLRRKIGALVLLLQRD